MPKDNEQPVNLTDAETARMIKLVDTHLEPKILKLINAFNDEIKKLDIVAGCEIQWFFDKIKKS